MAESDFLTTIFTHAAALISGSGLSGFLVKNHFTKKERKRQEFEETRKLALKLLPALQIAQREYTRFLSDSIYLHDIENEIYNSQISTITVCKANTALVAIIDSASLHLLDNRISTELASHKARMLILASELAERQSSLNYDYDHPEHLAVQAKDHLDRSLSDLVLALHHLRRYITIMYLGKDAWAHSERRLAAELAEMRNRAYSKVSWRDRWKKFKVWLELAYLRYYHRFRRWIRRFYT